MVRYKTMPYTDIGFHSNRIYVLGENLEIFETTCTDEPVHSFRATKNLKAQYFLKIKLLKFKILDHKLVLIHQLSEYEP